MKRFILSTLLFLLALHTQAQVDIDQFPCDGWAEMVIGNTFTGTDVNISMSSNAPGKPPYFVNDGIKDGDISYVAATYPEI